MSVSELQTLAPTDETLEDVFDWPASVFSMMFC